MAEYCSKFDTISESKHPEGLYLSCNILAFLIYESMNIYSIFILYQDEEMTLEFTEIFSKYESLIDRLFEEFATKNKTTSSTLYRCFRDVGMIFSQACLLNLSN